MLVGGEDLPKVSTQALKQQYEKTIEEAAAAKEIKVTMCVCLDASLAFYEMMRAHHDQMEIAHAAGGRRTAWFGFSAVGKCQTDKKEKVMLQTAPNLITYV